MVNIPESTLGYYLCHGLHDCRSLDKEWTGDVLRSRCDASENPSRPHCRDHAEEEPHSAKLAKPAAGINVGVNVGMNQIGLTRKIRNENRQPTQMSRILENIQRETDGFARLNTLDTVASVRKLVAFYVEQHKHSCRRASNNRVAWSWYHLATRSATAA